MFPPVKFGFEWKQALGIVVAIGPLAAVRYRHGFINPFDIHMVDVLWADLGTSDSYMMSHDQDELKVVFEL